MKLANYEVHERIGDGGFGEVFRATRRSDDREVAIKFLHEGAGADERHRFEREVRLIEGHDHRHIITVLDHELEAVRPFYVMPLMRGGTLTQWVGRLDHDAVRRLVRVLVDTVATIHAHGGIHRDIKPDNVLIDESGNVAVGDFGLGNNPKYTVMFTMHAAGTPGYAAPELFEVGGVASPAADIYSLGATLFHVLTGVHPLDLSELDPAKHAEDVPEDLRSLVLQLVAPDPVHRPSAAQLCDELGIRAPAPSSTPSSSVAARPHSSAAVVGGFTPRKEPSTIGGGRYG